MVRKSRIAVSVLSWVIAAAGGLSGAAPASSAAVDLGDTLALRSELAAAPSTLRVVGPDGVVADRRIPAGAPVLVSLVREDGSRLGDGSYRWELRELSPRSRVRPESETADAGLGAESSAALASGTFAVAGGAFVDGDFPESPARPILRETGASLATFDQVIPDDLIVQGSECVGVDCVNNENFGFDTIRLKENNLRIKFEDTSVGTFPSTDWQLTANDSASGGANRFSIEDVTAARVPFTILGGATSNSIFVASNGKVGFRTSTPVLDLHVATGDTPAHRFEQTGASGFSPQTWDVAGNEANFFVRDVTGGSLLPFRIRPGAPTSSIDIAASGNVGIGTASATAALDVVRSTGAVATMARLANNSGVQILYDRTDAGANDWQTSNFNTTFQISIPGAATTQFVLNANGNLTIGGMLTQLSSRSAKERFAPTDADDVLARLASLPISSWAMKASPEERHLGPFAEDWYRAFGLGGDPQHVAVTDLSGVALVAIQGLYAKLQEKTDALAGQEERIRRLEESNARLLEALAARGTSPAAR